MKAAGAAGCCILSCSNLAKGLSHVRMLMASRWHRLSVDGGMKQSLSTLASNCRPSGAAGGKSPCVVARGRQCRLMHVAFMRGRGMQLAGDWRCFNVSGRGVPHGLGAGDTSLVLQCVLGFL